MPNAKGAKRRFGSVRQYRSGRWTASYLDPTGLRRHAPETFATKTDAEVWLSQVEADLTRGDWTDPDAGAVNFEEYALRWVDERGLAPTSDELYRRLLVCTSCRPSALSTSTRSPRPASVPGAPNDWRQPGRPPSPRAIAC